MMLSFQNLHQYVLNLSQVTSAISSTYVRFTSNTVKKKPESDVYFSEGLIKTLKALEQSNSKVFEDLQNVKFSSRLEDMQWIFSKNINFRVSSKSGAKPDFYITLDKNDLKEFYLNFLVKNANKKQKLETLQELEAELSGKWKESFISRDSFDENKQNSYCGSTMQFTNSSPLCRRLFGTLDLSSNSPDLFSIQRRGFKTKRALDLEEKASSSVFSKLGKNFNEHIYDFKSKKMKDVQEKVFESPTVSKMVTDEAASPEEKLRLKVSFAEGYMVAVNDLKKPDSIFMKFFKFFWIAAAVFFVASLVASNFGGVYGKRKVFNLNFGRTGQIDPEEIDVTFSDVKGVQEVKEELMEIVEFLRDPAKFSSLGGKLPKGVLLVGPPGTGKTLLARAMAGEANVPFFHASGSEFDEIFVGEGARRVRNLFREAKAKAPSIIFIDEIDSVGSKRKRTTLHPYANQTINQLLAEMDGFSKNEGVIVIGATNRKSELDSALLRPGRFDVEVLVPLPDYEGRKEILELYMSKILCKDIDIPKLARATAGCSGADLEAMINHAAIKAATEGAPYVTMTYLENAKDKISLGPPRKVSMNDEDVMKTAYHESGHAIVSYFTEGADSIDKVTIVSRGESLGHLAQLPPTENYHITKAKCLARMDVCLGGRAADELIFGSDKITVNSSSDLDKATAIALQMIKDYGMSEKLGLRTLKNTDGGLVSVNDYGQAVSDEIDVEVKRLLQESYERSKNILKKHAKEHKLVAEALIKYKTLYPKDLKAILGEGPKEKSPSNKMLY